MWNGLSNLSGLLAQAEATGGETVVPYEHGSYFFPVQASSFAAEVDFLYYAIFWISTLFFLLIIGFMVYFAVKYRRRPGHTKALPSPSHNTPLEIAWSVIPSIILVWFFVAGAQGFFKMRVVPEAAEEIWVEAGDYRWQFTYPNGDQTPNELHLVVNQPVRFTLESKDYIHSFFIPAFRQKQDVVPGRYGHIWVNPTRVGRYRLYCAEYCGRGHSTMNAVVFVHPDEETRAQATEWIWEDMSPIENGHRLWQLHCSGCHRIDGDRSTGPPLDQVYGNMRRMVDGSERFGDEDYIRESILDPSLEIVEGYSDEMQSFQGTLDDDQIRWLIMFIRSLSDR